MKIDAKFFGAILFLIAQTSGAIWWASSLSAEVERLAGIQAVAIPALEQEAKNCGIAIHNNEAAILELQEHDKAISGLDVLGFRIDSLTEEISKLREEDVAQRKTMNEIMSQHESIFDMMQGNNMMQQKGGYGGYSYD